MQFLQNALDVLPLLTPRDGSLDELSEQECQICYERRREIRMRPCGHSSSCSHCTLSMIDVAEQRLRCPICKTICNGIEWPSAPPAANADGSITSPALEKPPELPPALPTFDARAAAEEKVMRVDAFVKCAADCPDGELASLGVSVLLQWTEAQNDGEALHRAAESADLAEARRLVAEDGACVDARDDAGQRPLHLAFARLLSADDGDTPPSSAVVEMVRFLLDMETSPPPHLTSPHPHLTLLLLSGAIPPRHGG